MSIKEKPSWVRPFVQSFQWVTIYPHIYASKEFFLDKANPRWTPVLNHEAIHLMRQKELGPLKWLARYAVDRQFRLSEEIEGIVVEIKTSPFEMRDALIYAYSRALSGPDYVWAASSEAEAKAAIMARLACAIFVPNVVKS